MNYEQSNVGMGMVPHKKSCRCNECEIERLTADNAKLLAVIDKALDEEYIPNEWLQAALEGQEQDDE